MVIGMDPNLVALGTATGELFVLRPSAGGSLELVASGLGTVTAMCFGDVRNQGRASLVVVTSEGLCHVFDDLVATATQRLPVNATAVMVHDIDGDGALELVFCTTNRDVYSYALQGSLFALRRFWKLAHQPRSLSACQVQGHGECVVVGTERRVSMLITRAGAVLEDTRAAGVEEDEMIEEDAGTQVLGNAQLSLDGTLHLFHPGGRSWSLLLDSKNLFAMSTVGGRVVCCAWDGMTYMIDGERNVACFHFGERVSAFSAGELGGSSALVYATYDPLAIHWFQDVDW